MKMEMILIVTLFCSILAMEQDSYQTKRHLMVSEQIAGRGIADKATLEAMRRVERHRLVPKHMEEYAYEDSPLPIGQNQTISQPYIVAVMTEAIRPRPGMKVLEIGTGSGYQAAVLAEIVDSVYTIETVEELAVKSRNKLKKMGYTTIHFLVGDGFHGWEEHAPYDAIIVTAAPEVIPPRLIEQLKPGGKMVIPVGSATSTQYLRVVEKGPRGELDIRNLLPVRFVPFTRRN